jgi:hypothetical protein
MKTVYGRWIGYWAASEVLHSWLFSLTPFTTTDGLCTHSARTATLLALILDPVDLSKHPISPTPPTLL